MQYGEKKLNDFRMLVLFLGEDGDIYEVYNGPGNKAFEVASKKDGYNHYHLQVSRLIEKSKEICDSQRLKQKQKFKVPIKEN